MGRGIGGVGGIGRIVFDTPCSILIILLLKSRHLFAPDYYHMHLLPTHIMCITLTCSYYSTSFSAVPFVPFVGFT